jgi:hypothetical protein
MWQVDLSAAQHLRSPLCGVKILYDYGLRGGGGGGSRPSAGKCGGLGLLYSREKLGVCISTVVKQWTLGTQSMRGRLMLACLILQVLMMYSSTAVC